jgi:SAM-dependent methyltransferase
VPELREGFDRVPRIYDRVRPRYPAPLFDELFARLPDSPDVVEVGPGTGQATGALLRHHARVTAVELGPNLADHLRRNFAGEDGLTVVVSSFEDVVLPAHSFDALVSASAYHWVDEPVRMNKPPELLRPGGWVSIIDALQVRAPTVLGFFERARHVYARYGQAGDHVTVPTPEQAESPYASAFRQAPGYDPVECFRYRWDQTYDTAGYADLMRSYSVSQAMPEREREALIADMSTFIDEDFKGQVTRPLVVTMMMARSLG